MVWESWEGLQVWGHLGDSGKQLIINRWGKNFQHSILATRIAMSGTLVVSSPGDSDMRSTRQEIGRHMGLQEGFLEEVTLKMS